VTHERLFSIDARVEPAHDRFLQALPGFIILAG
jgi:hypothetical protein